jgi:hypothetical protein
VIDREKLRGEEEVTFSREEVAGRAKSKLK